ncbi:hypothetical protein K1719_020734 [Acacia pycnantha]|nr:hypothetical protein K1719_020734 [Acacia pycnantha]
MWSWWRGGSSSNWFSPSVAHCDVKPQNLLLDPEGNMKVSDFGLSTLPKKLNNGLLHTACGTSALIPRQRSEEEHPRTSDFGLFAFLEQCAADATACNFGVLGNVEGGVSAQLGIGNFSFEEPYKATGKFSADKIIGEGGFGMVYMGKLNDGSLVAIKRSKKTGHDNNLAEFKNEINTLSRIEHLNLVRLYGYLEHEDEKMIVVEYVSHGTLREHLNGTRGNGLEIGERLDIAIDVAHAITYLHMYRYHPIIHRDIKSSNILLTEKLRAKVADFGFARLASDDPAATHISTQIKGTAGYLDLRRYPLEPKKPLGERVTIRWVLE